MKKKILIMDDEHDVREILSDMLTFMGHEAVSSPEGKEAIRLYESTMKQGKPFDAVILDLTIPKGMGGEETAEHLRSIDPAACIIYSSGRWESASFEEKGGPDLQLVLSKPYTMKQLEEVVTKAMLIRGRERSGT